MRADGAEVQRLTDDPAEDYYPAWSPDGLSIIFSSNRVDDAFDLFRLTLGTNALQNLTDNRAQDGSHAFSPDGTLLLFDSNREGNYEIYILDLATLGVTRVTHGPDSDVGGDWRPMQ